MNEGVKPQVKSLVDDPLRLYILVGLDELGAEALEEQIFCGQQFSDALDASELELLRDEALGILSTTETVLINRALSRDSILRERKKFVDALVAEIQRSVEDLANRIESFVPVLIRYFRRRRPGMAEDLARESAQRAFQKGRGLPLPGEELHKYLFAFAGRIAAEGRRDRLQTVATDEELERLGKKNWNSKPQHIDSQIAVAELVKNAYHILGADKVNILSEYYLGDRQVLARKLGITVDALRVKIHRDVKRLRSGLVN